MQQRTVKRRLAPVQEREWAWAWEWEEKLQPKAPKSSPIITWFDIK